MKRKLCVLVRCWLRWGRGGAAGLSLGDVFVGVGVMYMVRTAQDNTIFVTEQELNSISWSLNVMVVRLLIMIFTSKVEMVAIT